VGGDAVVVVLAVIGVCVAGATHVSHNTGHATWMATLCCGCAHSNTLASPKIVQSAGSGLLLHVPNAVVVTGCVVATVVVVVVVVVVVERVVVVTVMVVTVVVLIVVAVVVVMVVVIVVVVVLVPVPVLEVDVGHNVLQVSGHSTSKCTATPVIPTNTSPHFNFTSGAKQKA
jgi:hypothetical protein